MLFLPISIIIMHLLLQMFNEMRKYKYYCFFNCLIILKDLYQLEDSLDEGENILDDANLSESDIFSGLSQEGKLH